MSSARGTAAHLDIGEVFERTGEIYQKSFGTFWVVALILLVPVAVIQAILGENNIISSIIQIIAGAWLVGSIVRIVQDAEEDGKIDLTVGEVLGSVWSRLLAIIVLEIIVGILVGIGLIIFIIPGIIIALVLAVSIPALVVEDRGIFDSMSRSAELTKDNRMRILAVGILMIVIVFGIVILTGLLAAIAPIVGVIAGLILGILLYPYISMLTTVLYYRLAGFQGGGTMVEETLVVEEDAGPPPAI